MGHAPRPGRYLGEDVAGAVRLPQSCYPTSSPDRYEGSGEGTAPAGSPPARSVPRYVQVATPAAATGVPGAGLRPRSPRSPGYRLPASPPGRRGILVTLRHHLLACGRSLPWQFRVTVTRPARGPYGHTYRTLGGVRGLPGHSLRGTLSYPLQDWTPGTGAGVCLWRRRFRVSPSTVPWGPAGGEGRVLPGLVRLLGGPPGSPLGGTVPPFPLTRSGGAPAQVLGWYAPLAFTRGRDAELGARHQTVIA